jgi:hypothetical protein
MVKKPKAKTPENITEFFMNLRGGPQDGAEEKLRATAKHFGMTPKGVQNKLKFWMSGPDYLRLFPDARGGKPKHALHKAKPEVIIDALNREGSIAKAADTLKCSPVTLKKIMEDKGIGQVYGLVKR